MKLSQRIFEYFVTFIILVQITMTIFQDYKPRIGLPVARPALNEAIAAIDKTTDVFYMVEAVAKAKWP